MKPNLQPNFYFYLPVYKNLYVTKIAKDLNK